MRHLNLKQGFGKLALSALLASFIGVHYTSFAAQNTLSSTKPIVEIVKPFNISSPFGWRTDPINGQSRFHAGVDLPAVTGTPILAAQGGYVVFSGEYGDYGQAVVIDHGSSLYTLYGHNSERLVTPGQYVGAGQPIARVGSTGRVTGPHLHFEVHYNKQYLNPTDYIGSYFKIPLGPLDMLPPVIANKPDNKMITSASVKPSPFSNTKGAEQSNHSAKASSAEQSNHGFLHGLFHRKAKVVRHVDPNERTIPLSWDTNGPSSVISWKDANATPPVPGHPRVQMVTGNRMETVEF